MNTHPDPGAAPVMRSGPALRLRAVTKRFGGFTANDGVDLDVGWGQIHALLGENGAGKTTLMRIVTGLYQPDEGGIEVAGEPAHFRRPEQALRAGIGMVHQHFTLVSDLTELENVAMRPSAFPWKSDLRRMRRTADQVAESTGLRITPDRLVEDASISERQRIEIVKLLCRGARILIFDEPSAAISPDEWEELAALMKRLAADGHAVVLISHKLTEVFSVADRYTVLRRGAVVDSGDIASVTPEHLVSKMVGGSVDPRPPLEPSNPGDVVLAVAELEVARDGASRNAPPALSDIGFEVRRGEIVGVAGVAGSGQRELVEAIVGVTIPSKGGVSLSGVEMTPGRPQSFYEAGGALIPEDRHHVAIIGDMALWENITMRMLRAAPLQRHGIIDVEAAKSRARTLMEEFDVRADSETQPIGRLSGGNQQKAVLARELSGGPELLIAVQPVRGLDVRATDFVYRRLIEHRDAGGAVLLISMDLDEVLAMSDRIVVLAHGRIQGELAAAEATRETVGALMTSAVAA
ncbi:ABC transporter ATP-binding protein [Plantibacter sp. YIM 135347]|uniref:ABC transporter ATP-binding protein n=1 Tax=Plantibacter sp. YIM 135347 TaxID=3423919 RepID=UPI003D32FFD0